MKKGEIKKKARYLTWMAFHFSGLRFVWEKINPPSNHVKAKDNYRAPSNFILWTIGLYTACFGIASQRYENSVDILENRTNAVLTLVVKDESRKSALKLIPKIQGRKIPLKPDILKPLVTFKSLFLGKYYPHQETIEILKRTIENFKDQLSVSIINNADLSDMDLMGAKFIGTDLTGSNLSNTNLSEADLRGAVLERSNLRGTDLRGANLGDAILFEADLTGADLSETNLYRVDFGGACLKNTIFRDAVLDESNLQNSKNITIEQLLTAKSLYKVKLDLEIKRKLRKIYKK